MSDRTAPRVADDDLRGLGDLLERHLPQIAQGILRTAEAAHSAAVLQREVVRPHATVTGPAHQTGDDPVLAPLLQHAERLYKESLWKRTKGERCQPPTLGRIQGMQEGAHGISKPSCVDFEARRNLGMHTTSGSSSPCPWRPCAQSTCRAPAS